MLTCPPACHRPTGLYLKCQITMKSNNVYKNQCLVTLFTVTVLPLQLQRAPAALCTSRCAGNVRIQLPPLATYCITLSQSLLDWPVAARLQACGQALTSSPLPSPPLIPLKTNLAWICSGLQEEKLRTDKDCNVSGIQLGGRKQKRKKQKNQMDYERLDFGAKSSPCIHVTS